jgi:hypothetical protein
MKQNLLILSLILTSVFASAQLFTSPYQANNFLAKSLNNALDFDGVDDCVVTTTLDVNYSAMPITTWEAWVLPTANNANWRTIFGIEDGGWDRNLFVNGGNFHAGYLNGGWQITSANLNEWQHVAIVYNEASGVMKFYKNGTLFTFSTNIGIPSSVRKFAIGCSQQGSPNHFFQGKISDVRVWNVERTQAQIQANMNKELTGEETGLVAYYPFKQGIPHQSNTSITTLFDEVGTHNGTITNFALSGTSSNFTFGKIESRVPRNNLVMHVNPAWRRSYSGSGTLLSDLTENGNNMNLLNSPIYSGVVGGTLTVNGAGSSVIQTVNNAPISGTNKRTIAMWFLPQSFNTSQITNIISTGSTANNSGMFGVYGNATNKLGFWGHNSDFVSGQSMLLENWNFIATTYDGTGIIKLHVNGVTESVGRTLNTVSNKIDLMLHTRGSFGEMMVYDRDLSASDLAYLYNRTREKYPVPDGLTPATAATSAKAIKAAYPASTDGVYYINLPTVGIQPVFCLMDNKYDGGGWMMAMKATRGTTFNFDANYWYTANTLNPAQTNRNDGDAKFDVFNYYAGKDLLALWPDIPNASAESGSIDNLTNWSWLQNNFNSGTSGTLISFFAASPTQRTIETSNNNTGTMNFNGYGTPFSKQTGFTFYGLNYITHTGTKVRWGFSWNNETDQGSNDVSGGIGMASGSFSAGDRVTCCSSFTGINRTARVEMYVR